MAFLHSLRSCLQFDMRIALHGNHMPLWFSATCRPACVQISRNVGKQYYAQWTHNFHQLKYSINNNCKIINCSDSLSHRRQIIFRIFSSSSKRFSTRGDDRQEARRKILLKLTYLSGLIGVCLLSAIGFRHYASFAQRAKGIEPIRIREYGRRPHLFQYRGFVFPGLIVNDVKSIHHFEVREDDVWVVSFPKAGTTWVQEIVYLICNDVDTEKAQETTIDVRFPFLEFIYPGKKAIAAMPSPRFIKSHLPMSMLPNQVSQKKPKIVYIARNPKDTVVSLYHFATQFLVTDRKFTGSFEDYCQLFVEDLVDFGPWWKHVKEAWNKRDEDNVLMLFYEDLQMDPHKAVSDIAEFLNKSLTTSQIDTIVQHCSFDSMRDNKTVNYEWLKESGWANKDQDFLRKGKVGDWKNHLSQDIVTKLDEMVATKLTPLGIPIKDTLEKPE